MSWPGWPATWSRRAGVRSVVLGDGAERGIRALEYDQCQFPAFFQWLHLREGAYAVGFEPSTHAVAGEQAARDDGTMIWLAAGESRSYTTTFRILDQAAPG